MKIQKGHLFIIFGIVLLSIGMQTFQYLKTFKEEIVSAVTVGTPNPGHALSDLECSADSLCVDTTNNYVGIGTNTPTTKLDVNGVINLNSNKITNVAVPTASTDVATKEYVDAAGSSSSCVDNYGNLCLNGGGLTFTYNGKILHIDAYPSALFWYSSDVSGQGLAWQVCRGIGARLPTGAEWAAACVALGGPSGNGMTTFGGQDKVRYEWAANPTLADQSFATFVGGKSCSVTYAWSDDDYAFYTSGGNWFRCIR